MLHIFQPFPKSNDIDGDFARVWYGIITPTFHDPLPDGILYEHRVSGYLAKFKGATSPGGQNRYVLLFLLETSSKAIPVVVVASAYGVYQNLYDEVVRFLDTIRVGPVKAQPPKTRITIADLVGEWETDSNASQTYVNSYTGAYAGSSIINTGKGYKIAADGSYTSVEVAGANLSYSRTESAGRVEFKNGEIVFRDRANNSTGYRFISYETAPDGSIVLMLLPAQYTPTRANIDFYVQKWIRSVRRK